MNNNFEKEINKRRGGEMGIMGGSNVVGAKTEGAKGKVLGQRDD